MAELKEYRFYLRKRITSSSYSYYYVQYNATNKRDEVYLTNTSTPELEFAPEGWEETKIEWIRGFEHHGVFSQISTELKFVNDGALILRDVYYKQGDMGNAELLIEKVDHDTKTYDTYFRGDIDFIQSRDERPYYMAKIMDGNLTEKMRTRKGSTYELDIDSHPDYFYIKMQDFILKSILNYTTITERSPFPSTPYTDINFKTATVPTIAFVDGDSTEVAGVPNFQGTAFRDWFSATTLIAKPREDFFFKAVRACDYSLDLDFRVALSNQSGSQDPIKLEVRLLKYWENEFPGNGTVIMTTPSFQPSNGGTTIHNINLTTTGSMLKGEKLGLLFNVVTASGIITNKNWKYDFSIEAGDITLEFETKVPEAYIKALHPKKMFDFLIDEIYDSSASKNAPPLVSNQSYAITCGDALRTITGAKIKTSYDDFFKAYGNILNLASYFDGTSQNLDYKSEVYDDSTQIYDIGEVSNFHKYTLEPELMDSFTMGYEKLDIEGLNGREAFCGHFQWDAPLIRSQGTRDFTVPYLTDCYTIEIHRINLSEKTSTASDIDNDVAIIHTKSSPSGTYNGKDYYELERDPLMTITGVSYPDNVYNIDLSPKRNLIRLGSYIRSLLRDLDTEYIKFKTADRNSSLSTTLGSYTVDEDADVLVSDLASPIFAPVVFEFDCINPVNIQSLLDSNPYGYLSFTVNGTAYKGFLFEAKDNPWSKESQTLKLIASPTTNLENLIYD